MHHRFPRLVLPLAILTLAAPARAAERATAPARGGEPVTFAEHVAPLVFRNCTVCHRPGEAAPFPLVNYANTRKHARTMLEVMESHTMPPWQPEPGYGEFRDSRRLDDEQIALFRTWVRTGMAEGDPARTPALPTFPAEWQLGTPDLVVSMDRPFQVPAGGRDIYRNFVLPLRLTEKKWVTAVEFRASAPTVVHHALYFVDSTGSAAKLDGADGQPGFSGMGFRGNGRLGGWAVGATPRKLPDGLAWPLPANAELVVQIHFHPSGKPESEKLTFGLYFADKAPSRTLTGVMLPPAYSLFSGLDIPPGKKDFTVRDSFTLPVDVDVIGAGAHAHILGKSLKLVAELPDRTVKPMFWIKDWDFNWQGQYFYTQSVRLPKGTVLRGEVVWDNSADNPRNPHVPPVRVSWGEATGDEMGSVNLLMVAANEAERGKLNTAYANHVREAVVLAGLRGDTKHWKELGIRPKLFSAPKPGADTGAKPAAPEPPPGPAKKPAQPAKNPAVRDLDGRLRRPLDLEADKARVVFFVTPECPICNTSIAAINALQAEFAGRPVSFVAVQVDPDLTPTAARKHADEFGLCCPVVLDPDHRIVTAVGATVTPEAVVITPDGAIAYRGRIDDTYPRRGAKRNAPTRRDLREALAEVLAGKPVTVARTPAVGCLIPEIP